MNSARDSLLSDRPPGWPAWCTSLLVHALLLIVVLYWLRPPVAEGAAEQPSRDVGIVLKQMTDDGPLFEDEENQPTVNDDAPSLATDSLLKALPSASELPSSEASLPKIPTLGLGTSSESPAGKVLQMAGGAAPAKKIGNKATVSVFGISGTGTRFVYVFDRSISMAGPPLRAAKQQLIASLDSLESVHQFQIIFFNHEPQAWDLTGGQSRIAFATDANKRLAEKFVRGVSATGGTFRRTALKLALRLGPDVIFFLSDTDDPMATSDLNEAIGRARRDGIAINTIEYGTGVASKGENFLVRLARETGGRYVYVDTQQLGP